MKKKHTVRLAILGTGGMANIHAGQFQKNPAVKLIAACDVNAERAAAFAAKHAIPEIHTDAAAMLKKSDIDAVSIVTPDAFHAPLSIQCLRAGKHVLCEKPLAVHYPEARKMAQAAKKAGVINMVNFSYRSWPAIQGAAAAVQKGRVGELRHVEASYLQAWLVCKTWGDWRTTPAFLWRLSSRHGSLGVLGDVGVHIVDFATYPAGPVANVFCRLKTFDKAKNNRIGEYTLDANDSAVLQMEFKNGALGTIHATRWCPGHTNRLFLRVSGTKGTVEIDSDRSTDSYRICAGRDVNTAAWKEVKVPPTPDNYQRFIRSILTGTQDQPDFARGAEIQKVLDAGFASDAERRVIAV